MHLLLIHARSYVLEFKIAYVFKIHDHLLLIPPGVYVRNCRCRQCTVLITIVTHHACVPSPPHQRDKITKTATATRPPLLSRRNCVLLTLFPRLRLRLEDATTDSVAEPATLVFTASINTYRSPQIILRRG